MGGPLMIPHALHALFHHGFKAGETGHGERKKGFALRPGPNESILVFQVDEIVATALEINDKPKCDALMLYVGETAQETIVRLAAIELKGNKHDHAVEQLSQTLSVLIAKLRPLLGPEFFKKRGLLRALIVTDRSPPIELAREKAKFQKTFGFAPVICPPNNEDLLRQNLEIPRRP